MAASGKGKNFGKLNFSEHCDREEYNQLYALLKAKYAKALIENWSETTDAAKFVHEDLGIACFLILLWKEQAPCTFVDLGCGNGLLVYLLTSEGHKGKGIDVRKRNIWNTFPETTVLEEDTIIPSSKSVYSDADWLIGNHSDELTAWLPIMAARSNSKCNFFTIPCCPYELNGAKFQRRNSKLSVYQDFLEYVQDVGEKCNFKMTAEKMRIPSTKRICLIGHRLPRDQQPSIAIDRVISNLIDDECPQGVNTLQHESRWIRDFKPRVAIEPVRNCTKVPQGIQLQILCLSLNCLLSSPNLEFLEGGRTWNKGQQVELSEIAKNISSDLLEKLKSECRGLQTLLKNHQQVFTIKYGKVALRSPENLRVNSQVVRLNKYFKWKEKPCWFHNYHPDGCPLPEQNCSYFHAINSVKEVVN